MNITTNTMELTYISYRTMICTSIRPMWINMKGETPTNNKLENKFKHENDVKISAPPGGTDPPLCILPKITLNTMMPHNYHNPAMPRQMWKYWQQQNRFMKHNLKQYKNNK